ncbi:MAG: hypothetical protein JJD92_14215 [Frankiaceae bacterium]|nr:hypothetical protein [Frankiaceae bacterium]
MRLDRHGWLVETAAATAVGLLLAVFFTWPAIAHPASTVPGDLGDPLYQAWQLSWGGHALLHAPLDVWNANILFPLDNSLAFSDSLLGYAPLGLVGSGVGAALVRYNVVYLLAYTLAFAGTYVLARQLGCGRWAAVFAGVCFAYAPWRFAHNGHLNILSSGGIPLALACLVRGNGPVKRPRWAVVGWLVAAWQLTLGFGLGLQFASLMGILVLLAVGTWFATGRPPVPRRLLVANAAGLGAFLLVGVLFALPYVRAVNDHPEARRSAAEVALYSPPLRGLVTAPGESRVWGPPSEERRAGLPAAVEQALFPGLSVLLLAGVGLLAGGWSVRRRIGLAVGTVVATAFAMGTQFVGGGRFTYLLLFEHVPGWQGVRTPGRLITLVSLGLVLLAATGVDRLQSLVRRRAPARVLGALVITFALVEGLNTVGTPSVGPVPSAWRGIRGPVMALPSDYGNDYAAMLWSTEGLPGLVNGTAGFIPRELERLRAETAAFPDASSVAALRAIGVRTVLLDTTRSPGTPWEGAASRAVDGLGISRRDVGSSIVFDLAPGS